MHNVLRPKWSGVQWYIMPGPSGMEMLLRDGNSTIPRIKGQSNLMQQKLQGRCKPASSVWTRLWIRLLIRRGKASWGRWEWSRFLNNGQQVQLQEKKTGHGVLFYDMSSSSRIKSLFHSEQMSKWVKIPGRAPVKNKVKNGRWSYFSESRLVSLSLWYTKWRWQWQWW